MKRFFAKIGRFFWSRGFLKFVLWTVTLVIFFYIEEDWRGASAWAATKAKWEAKGESFDLATFIPAPIPDDQNVAAIPAFKLERIQGLNGSWGLEAVVLRKANNGMSFINNFPPSNDWRRGELPDMEKIRQAVAAKYTEVLKSAPPTNDPLDQLDAAYPFMVDLRANATRPYCRFAYDDLTQVPAERSFTLIVYQMFISKVLSVRALFELENHRPDLALEELKLNFKLASGVRRDPGLVSIMVEMGMISSMGSGVIYQGLTEHLWNDAQLVELDHLLKPVDYLADYQFGLRCEVLSSVGKIDYLKHIPRAKAYQLLRGMSQDSTSWNWLHYIWADGWFDEDKCRMADLVLSDLPSLDSKTHRAFPEVEFKLVLQFEHMLAEAYAYEPWIMLSLGMYYVPTSLPSFVQNQVWVDETRIACALERYRLAHGAYPRSLDALMPAYIDELPHDVMNGEPYRYRLQLDGTFLLYSVGGNKTDDGGKVVDDKTNHNRASFGEGDWAWPTPQVGASK